MTFRAISSRSSDAADDDDEDEDEKANRPRRPVPFVDTEPRARKATARRVHRRNVQRERARVRGTYYGREGVVIAGAIDAAAP